jgi:hypothetical protein
MDHEGKNVPRQGAFASHTMFTMSMYVDILSSALGSWVDNLTGSALIDYVLICRADLLRTGQHGDTAYSSLTAEVAFDRALIKLCQAHHVNVATTAFAHPRNERTRLERELVFAGIDLGDLARQRHRA